MSTTSSSHISKCSHDRAKESSGLGQSRLLALAERRDESFNPLAVRFGVERLIARYKS